MRRIAHCISPIIRTSHPHSTMRVARYYPQPVTLGRIFSASESKSKSLPLFYRFALQSLYRQAPYGNNRDCESQSTHSVQYQNKRTNIYNVYNLKLAVSSRLMQSHSCCGCISFVRVRTPSAESVYAMF